MPKAMRIECWN